MIEVDSSNFKNKIRQYAKIAGKSLNDALLEEAKFTAKRLMELTPPKNAAQGKKRIAIDIGSLFLKATWFLDVFHFTNKKIDERVKELVRNKDEEELGRVFRRSNSLNKIHLEGFDSSRHKKYRRNGRVTVKEPNSFPLTEQAALKTYEKDKHKLAGYCKNAWANCYTILGGAVAGWLTKFKRGQVIKKLQGNNPSVTLVNTVGYFDYLNRRMKIVSRSLDGRERDLAKKIKNNLKRAKDSAGFK